MALSCGRCAPARRGGSAALLALLAACGGGAPGRVRPDPGAAPAAVLNAGPRSAGTIVLLGFELPPAGQRIGGHFEGALYDAEVASLQMGEGARRRWSDAAREAGDSVLRAAGYTVRPAPARSSDAAPLTGVRFGLSAQVALSVRTIGRVEPRRVVVRAESDWELLDLANGAAVYSTVTRGDFQADDSVAVAVVGAVSRSLLRLLGDSAFQAALVRRRRPTLEDLVFGALWERPLPGPADTVWIEPGDINAATVADPVQRVAAGVMAVHGRARGSVTALTLTRGGLAIATALPPREQRLWGRFHDGVDHPLRIVRSRDGLTLLQVQCDDPCTTVPWADSIPLVHAAPVFIVASPVNRGDAFFVANGRFYLRQPRNRLLSTYDLGVDDAEGGEPVARAADGLVYAVATPAGAVLLREAFRILGIAIRPVP